MKRTLAALVLCALALGGGLAAGAGTVRAAAEPYGPLDTFARALVTVERNYVEEVEPRHLVYAALRGMVAALDPHSLFLDPDEYADLRAQAEGRFHGIGVELEERGGAVAVVRVVPRSPAERAGVRRGDLLRAVDGEPVRDLAEAEERLAGEEGAAVHLELDRGGERVVVEAVREAVVDVAAEGELLAGRVAHVRLAHFHRRAARDLRREIDRLAGEADGPLAGLVLDLRGNPGGLLAEAVAVLDLFLGEGPAVEVVGRGGVVLDRHRTRDDPDDLVLPLVVLVDGRSASAAEIVAGALRARSRARLVGAPTWGKGSVQQVWEFEDGSALKLTVARYAFPDGTLLEPGVGLRPDVEVGETPEARAARLLRAEISELPVDAATRRKLLGEVEALAPAPAATESGGADAALEAACRLLAAG